MQLCQIQHFPKIQLEFFKHSAPTRKIRAANIFLRTFFEMQNLA